MAGRMTTGLLACLGLALLSSGLLAGEPKEPGPAGPPRQPGGPAVAPPGFPGMVPPHRGARNPEEMLKRLDANKDGAIAADEIPPGMPEPMKAWLQKADKNGDKKVTTEELRDALKAGPPMGPWAGRERPRRGAEAAGPRPQRPESAPKDRANRPSSQVPGPKPPAGPAMAPGSAQPARPGMQLGRVPDPKTLFAMMDKNHDGSLSLDEFTDGTKEIHGRISERLHKSFADRPRPMGPAPGRAMGPQPGPGAGFGMGRGQGMGGGFGMGWHQMGGPPAMGWWRGPMAGPPPSRAFQACPCPWCRMHQPMGPSAESRRGPESWGRGPASRPGPSPQAVGGPKQEDLRRLVAKLVREEVAKVLREKDGPGPRPEAEPARPRPPRHDGRPDARGDRAPRDPRP